jgi:hypothetical protein
VTIAADEPTLTVRYADGRSSERTGRSLDAETSQHILRRDGHIAQLTIAIPQGRGQDKA